MQARLVFPVVLIPGFLAALVIAATQPGGVLPALVSGGVAAGVTALLVVLARWIWSSEEALLGSGDILIAAAIGAALGPDDTPRVLLMGMVLAAVTAGISCSRGVLAGTMSSPMERFSVGQRLSDWHCTGANEAGAIRHATAARSRRGRHQMGPDCMDHQDVIQDHLGIFLEREVRAINVRCVQRRRWCCWHGGRNGWCHKRRLTGDAVQVEIEPVWIAGIGIQCGLCRCLVGEVAACRVLALRAHDLSARDRRSSQLRPTLTRRLDDCNGRGVCAPGVCWYSQPTGDEALPAESSSYPVPG